METAQERRRKPELHSTLAAILAHPLRCRILGVTSSRVASPKELAQEFGEPLGNVSYHVRKLEQMGWLELVGEKKRRGANEHFYRATEMAIVEADDLAAMSLDERNQFFLVFWQFLTASAGAALDAGVYARRPETTGFRIPGTVDEEGWKELEAASNDFFERIFSAIEKSASRIADDPEAEQIPVVAAGAFFESVI
jgi:DNA-binding transcriptional ArsR family regulator